MRLFYILLIILSGVYLLVQTVAWLFFGKRFFPDAGELFRNKKDKNLWQTVFPKDMLRLIIVIFVAGIVGLLTDAAGLEGWMTMPIGAVAGIVVNFMINTVWVPIYDKIHMSGEPSDEELEGISARVIENIDEDNFGVISLRHGAKSYLMRAVTANGRTLPKGTAVIVIYAQDGCCFVESEEHFFDVLFEEEKKEEEKEEDRKPSSKTAEDKNKRHSKAKKKAKLSKKDKYKKVDL